MRHRHYTPRADVVVVDAGEELKAAGRDAYIGLSKPPEGFQLTRVCANSEEYASALFEFFRECDRVGVAKIYCESVSQEGIGAALMDRIRRASAD
jgi:L-threonylcarbamoyladenylate synthase